MEMRASSALMRLAYFGIEAWIARGFGWDRGDPRYRMMLASSAGAPLRTMQINGGIRGGLFAALAELANGRPLAAAARLAGAPARENKNR